MYAAVGRENWRIPDLHRAGRFHELMRALLKPMLSLLVVLVILVSEAESRTSASIGIRRVERDGIRRHRERRELSSESHRVRVVLAQRLLVFAPPLRHVVWEHVHGERDRTAWKPRLYAAA